MSSQIPSALEPSTPLKASYTYHSETPTAAGPYILGVDEAGRGPVLGPLVYGIAYCPVAYKEKMEELGFAGKRLHIYILHDGLLTGLYGGIDSKTLNSATRSTLLDVLRSDPPNLGWSVRVVR